MLRSLSLAFLLLPSFVSAQPPARQAEPKVISSPPLENKAPMYPQPDDATLLAGFDREFAGQLPVYGGPGKKLPQAECDAVIKQLREGLGVTRDAAGKVSGKPIAGKGGYGVAAYLKLLKHLDHCYAGGSAAQREILKPAVVDCVEHFANAEGTNEGWRKWANYGGERPAFPSIYRAITLAPQEIGDTFAEKFFLAQAIAYEMPTPDLQMDDLKGSGAEAIRLPVAIRDPKRRLAAIKKAHEYANRLILAPLNFSPEGGPMHHTIWHYYYASYSTGPFFDFITRYHRAGWYFSEAAYIRMRRLGYAAAFIVAASNNVHPLNGGGRPGLVLNMGGGVADWLNAGAQSGYQGDPKKYFPTFAAAFLHNFPTNREAKRYKDAGIQPAPIPDGHLTMNIGALSAHRRKDWNITVAGLSPATYKHEIYSWMQYNNYSQYARWGSHIISHPSFANQATEGGFALSSGFNWAFIPGATCPATPDYRLIVRREKSYISNGGMSGGCDLDGNGVWGQDQSSGPGASFRKSAFAFGDHVTFITTNVKAQIPKDATPGEKTIHTTLAQWPVDEKSPPLEIGQRKITAEENLQSIPLSGWQTVVDSKGNAYVIEKNPNATLRFRRGQQTYYLFRDTLLIDPKVKPIDFGKITVNGERFNDKNLLDAYKYFKQRIGNYELAYLEHTLADGSIPAGSVYHILPMTGKNAADQFKASLESKNPPCTILQRDGDAHVLRDNRTPVIAYVVFSAKPVTAAGPLVSMSNPGTAMFRKNNNGTLAVSLSVPIKREPMDTTIVLKGHHTFTPAPGQTFEITHLPDKTTRLKWLKHDYTATSFELTARR
ncbi:MAG: polysaccharide lyase family 8 super-sandwich domain-containing protein [Verrucomicrobiota bacterium]